MKRCLSSLALIAPLFASALAHARDLPNVNVYYDGKIAAAAQLAPGAAPPAVVSAVDDRRGVPSFLWAARPSSPGALTAIGPERAARIHLERHAARYGVSLPALGTAEVSQVHDLGHGGIIVVLRQRIGGVDLFRSDVKVLMDRSLDLVAIGGNPHAAATPKQKGAGFKLPAPEAIARAFRDLYDVPLAARDLLDLERTKADYRYYELAQTPAVKAAQLHFVEPARVRKIFFPLPDRIVPAYFVELLSGKVTDTSSDAFAYVIAADDGRLLYRENLTHEETFNYRVWADPTGDNRFKDGPLADFTPHPTGHPDGSYPGPTAPVLISIDGFNVPHDPWLPAGAMVSTGNNVDAYTDDDMPDGFSPGDIRASISSPGTFDHVYDLNAGPQSSDNQRMASVTQLFYLSNWLHDWWYDSGFNEAAGNAQEDNYGRGGVAGDPLHAEAQDGAPTSRNNSNMSAMYDGASPRMQMYVWDGNTTSNLGVQPLNQNFGNATAGFGPTSFDVTAAVALVNDGTAPVTDACQAVTGDLTGEIALVDRGTCSFKQKAANVQAAGAIGMIIADNVSEASPPPLGDDPSVTTTITIPLLSISMTDGASIKSALAQGTVTATLSRQSSPDRDGGLDNTVAAHEWGHMLHLRQVACSTQMCGAESEGWADFDALQMVVRPGDDLHGTYALAQYAVVADPDDPAYFGIRRYPYSVDFTKNALTFKNISNGQAFPPGVVGAASLLDPTSNSEVHNAGEIWASMLFEGFVALLEQSALASPPYTFDQARRRMADYVVGGMKLAPVDPTYLEQRDAILAATFAADQSDFAILAQAFARRGAGSCAVSPPRDSTDFTGVVESFDIEPNVTVTSYTLDDSIKSCDMDGILDAEETGNLTIHLVNGGAATSTGAVLKVSTTTAGATFPNGASVNLDPMAPYATATAKLQVALAPSVAKKEPLDLTITVDDPNACSPMATLATAPLVNYDVVMHASTIDDVEAPTTTWTISGTSGDQVWSRVETSPGDHAWVGVDFASNSETSIVSPLLTVGTTDPLIFQFDHRHEFETSMGTFWDGGVIEISTDGGAKWDDISMYGDPGYGGSIGGAMANNPLLGRMGYVDQNPSWPARDHVTVSLGMAFAGKTVRVRFNEGTDDAGGDIGWEIDNIAFEGITNTPFTELVDDASTCGDAPSADAGPDQVVTSGDKVTLDASKSTDPKGKPLTYAWHEITGPAASISGSTSVTSNFIAPAVALDTTLTFQVTVSDGTGAASATVNVLVKPGAGTSSSSSSGSGGSGGSGGGESLEAAGGGGCGCFVTGMPAEAPAAAPLAALAALLIRRRRRR